MALALQPSWRAAWNTRTPTGQAAVTVIPRWHVVDVRASSFPPFTTLCGRTVHVSTAALRNAVPDEARCYKCLISYRAAIGTVIVI